MKFYQILAFSILVFASSCVKNKKGIPETNQIASAEKAFVVKEVVQTTSYTYLRVDENNTERWVAVTQIDAKNGEKYYYDEALQMNNFHSKELNRDFETIYFINKVSSVPFSMQKKMNAMPPNHSGKAKAPQSSSVSLDKEEGELTLAQVFENSKNYSENEFEITGVVVKVNKQVMGKNWVHIQDGTKHKDSFDLTITTMELPTKNDIVTFKGKLTLDKDFGAGYFYKVIMEDAALAKLEKPAEKL